MALDPGHDIGISDQRHRLVLVMLWVMWMNVAMFVLSHLIVILYRHETCVWVDSTEIFNIKLSILNMWSEWTMVGLWKCDKHVIYLSNPNLDHKPLKNFLFFSGNSLMNEDISICRPDYGIKRSLKFCDSLGLFSSFFFSSFFLSLHFFNVFVI